MVRMIDMLLKIYIFSLHVFHEVCPLTCGAAIAIVSKRLESGKVNPRTEKR